MDNKVRIMCFFPIILSVVVTIFYGQMNKEPPIDYESYQRMPPLYAVDDYDQCINEFETEAKYCVANIVIEKDKTSDLWNQIEEFSSQEKYHFRHDILKWGFCMNKVRQNLTDSNIKKDVRSQSGENPFMGSVRFRQLGKILTEFQFSQEDENDLNLFVTYKFETEYGLRALTNITFCVSKTNGIPSRGSRVLNLLCISIIVVIFYSTIIATIVDLCRNKETTIYPKNFYTSISLRTNINHLFRNPSNGSQWRVLNGIKVVGEAGVVVVHTAYILLALPTAISFTIESQMYDPIVPVIRSVVFQLQNFFAITAFLSFYPSLSRILKGEPLSRKDVYLMIFKRIVRLWPLIIFVLLFSSTLLYRIKDGPIWMDLAGTEMISCRKNWWANLMFINNFYGANTDPCLQQSWHLAAEMQLFVVELFVILLVSRFPKKAGTIITSVFLLGNFIAALVFYKEKITGLELGTVEHIRTRNALDPEFQRGHIPFYTNTPGYFIGLLAASIQYQIKQNQIDLSNKTKLFRIWYAMFLSSGLILLHHSFYADTVTPPSLLIAIYSTLCKNIGAIITVTLLIFMGNVSASDTVTQNILLRATGIPMIDALLLRVYNFYNHGVFKILVKLNLGVFLIHPFVAFFIISDGKKLNSFGSPFDVAWIGLGTLLGSYLIAAVLFVMIEMPVINLFRLVLYRNSTAVEQERKDINGKLMKID